MESPFDMLRKAANSIKAPDAPPDTDHTGVEGDGGLIKRGLSLFVTSMVFLVFTISCENSQLCSGLLPEDQSACFSCAKSARSSSVTEPFPPKERDLGCEAAAKANLPPKAVLVEPQPAVAETRATATASAPASSSATATSEVVAAPTASANVLSRVWQDFGEAPISAPSVEKPPPGQFEGSWSGQNIERMVVLGDSLAVGLFSDTVLRRNPPNDQVLEFLSDVLIAPPLPGGITPLNVLPEVDMFYRQENMGSLASDAPYSISHRLGVVEPVNLAASGSIVDDVNALIAQGNPELVAADLIAVSVGTNDFCAFGDTPDFQTRFIESYRTLLLALNSLGRRPVVVLKPILSPVTVFRRVADEQIFSEDIQVAISVMLGQLGSLGVEIPPYAFTLREHSDATCRQVIMQNCGVIARHPGELDELHRTIESANRAVADLVTSMRRDGMIEDRFVTDFACSGELCGSEINQRAIELADIKPYLALDCFHLSAAGHELVADVLFQKLIASGAVRDGPPAPVLP